MIDDEYWAQFPQVLSIADLSRITRKSEQTVWRWLGRGTIPAYKIAKAWVVYREIFQHRLEEPDIPYPLPVDLLATYRDELTVSELSELLGKVENTTYAWIAAGDLPAHRLGGSLVVYKHEIVQLFLRTSNQPSASSGN